MDNLKDATLVILFQVNNFVDCLKWFIVFSVTFLSRSLILSVFIQLMKIELN